MRPTQTDKLHVEITGDPAVGSALVKFAMTKLGVLKDFMRFRELRVGGPWVIPVSPVSTVTVFSLPGVRDIVRIVTLPSPSAEDRKQEQPEPVTVGGLLLLLGNTWEMLNVTYGDDSPRFLSGEHVQCGSGGGDVEMVAGNALIGWYTKCWESGDTIGGDLSGAYGNVNSCTKRVYHYTYHSYEILSSWDFIPGWRAQTPADYYYPTACRSVVYDRMDNTWSMTLDYITVMAFVRGNPHESYIYFCATYKGEPIPFDDAFVWPPSGVTRSDYMTKYPVLFDLWTWDGGETVYFGAPAGFSVYIWKFNEKEKKFDLYDRVRLVGIAQQENMTIRLCGYGEAIVYYHLSSPADPFGGQTVDQPVFAATLMIGSGRSTGGRALELVEDGEDLKYVKTTMWNPLLRELYVVYISQKDPESQDPSHTIEDDHIERFVINGWWTCFYTNSGGVTDCICWMCEDENYACPPATNWITDPWSITVEGKYLSGTVPIVGNEEGISRSVFWVTYHILVYDSNVQISYGQDFNVLILRGGASVRRDVFEGGKRIEQYRRKWRLENGDIKDMIYAQHLCSQLTYEYALNRFMFSDSGYEIELLKATSEDCDYAPAGESKEGNGEVFIHAATPYPHDENWEAILRSGVDRDDEAVRSPVCIWKDAGNDSNDFGLFYSKKEEDRLGKWDRAVFMYHEYETGGV